MAEPNRIVPPEMLEGVIGRSHRYHLRVPGPSGAAGWGASLCGTAPEYDGWRAVDHTEHLLCSRCRAAYRARYGAAYQPHPPDEDRGWTGQL